MPTVTDDMMADALPAVRYLAVGMARRGLPPGIDADDLESAGNEALLEARAGFDPLKGYSWLQYAKLVARSRMKAVVAKAAKVARRRADLEVETEDGDFLPRPDPRAARSDDLAAAREPLAAGGRRTLSVKRLRGELPPPDVVAEKVAALREAMFAAVKADDVSAVMASVVAAAKAGDLKAAKLLLDYLQPGRSGVLVQQAVVVNAADMG